jgi:DNA-binding SARP family transcriptional activator
MSANSAALEFHGVAPWKSRRQIMAIWDRRAALVPVKRSQEGMASPGRGSVGCEGTLQLLGRLLVPRDPRGIVLLCGFVGCAAFGLLALLTPPGDPIGWAYLGTALVGYLFIQTRGVPTFLWLLIAAGGATVAVAGNASGWVETGLGILLAAVALVSPPAEFRGLAEGQKATPGHIERSMPEASPTGRSEVKVETSRKLEDSPTRTSRTVEDSSVRLSTNAEVGIAASGDRNDHVQVDDQPNRAAAADATQMAIRAMGHLRLEAYGRDLTKRLNEQPRLEFLFSYLLARTTSGGDVGVDRAGLADEVAPGLPASAQRDRLRKQLYALREALGSELRGLVQINSSHVRLDLEHVEFDVAMLRELSKRVSRRAALIDTELVDEVRRRLDDTAGGEFLASFSELEQQVTEGHGTALNAVEEARAEIVGWRSDLVHALAEYHQAAGRPQASIAYLNAALALAPQRQDLARLLVAAYLQTGQTARADQARREYDLVIGETI